MDDLSQKPDIDFLIIADRAEAINGKLYMMGGAWDNINIAEPNAPINFSLALGINIPWNATNERHRLRLLIQDADGANLAELGAEFIAGRPPHLTAGSLQRVLFATGVGLHVPGPGTLAVVAYLNDEEARRISFQAVLAPPRRP